MSDSKKVTLEWKNKDKIFLGISDNGKLDWTDNRSELKVPIFVDRDGRKVCFKEDDLLEKNLLIKGDNLYAMQKLLISHRGKIKCIYIDPPFNTGKTFDHYADALDTDVWLSMMKVRLEIMRDLLSDDGSIFVHIDDDEMPYLKVLLDEIFSKDSNMNKKDRNHIATLIWQKKHSPQNDAKFFSDVHDFILVYAKNSSKFKLNLLERTPVQNNRYKNLDNDNRGVWTSSDLTVKTPSEKNIYPITLPSGRIVYPSKSRSWGVSKEKFEQLVLDNRIWFGIKGNAMPRMKKFLSEVKQGVTPKTLWTPDEVGDNSEAKKELKKILNTDELVFTTPKPERLLERIIKLATNKDDIVLDAFLGSGTTCAVAHKLNRRWIGIENGLQLESIVIPRINKVISGLDDGGVTLSSGWENGGSYEVYYEEERC